MRVIGHHKSYQNMRFDQVDLDFISPPNTLIWKPVSAPRQLCVTILKSPAVHRVYAIPRIEILPKFGVDGFELGWRGCHLSKDIILFSVI